MERAESIDRRLWPLAAMAALLLFLPALASADSGCRQYSTCSRCGHPVYAYPVFAGYDRCGHPVYTYVARPHTNCGTSYYRGSISSGRQSIHSLRPYYGNSYSGHGSSYGHGSTYYPRQVCPPVRGGITFRFGH